MFDLGIFSSAVPKYYDESLGSKLLKGRVLLTNFPAQIPLILPDSPKL